MGGIMIGNMWLHRARPNQMVTGHFVASELWCRCGFCEGFISVDAANALESLRVAHGKPIRPTSVYRCQKYNEQVGGAAHSFHPLGMAFDIPWASSDAKHRRAFVQLARDAGFTGIGYYPAFLHADMGPTRSWGKAP